MALPPKAHIVLGKNLYIQIPTVFFKPFFTSKITINIPKPLIILSQRIIL